MPRIPRLPYQRQLFLLLLSRRRRKTCSANRTLERLRGFRSDESIPHDADRGSGAFSAPKYGERTQQTLDGQVGRPSPESQAQGLGSIGFFVVAWPWNRPSSKYRVRRPLIGQIGCKENIADKKSPLVPKGGKEPRGSIAPYSQGGLQRLMCSLKLYAPETSVGARSFLCR